MENDQRSLQPAKLGKLSGLGIVTFVHGADGGLIEGKGTWRSDDESLGETELSAEFQVGNQTTYSGTVVDRRTEEDDASEGSLEVTITNVETYTYDDGAAHTLVSFVSRSEPQGAGIGE